MNRQYILTKLPEAHFLEIVSREFLSQVSDISIAWVLRHYRINYVPGVKRELRRQVSRNSHSRHNPDVKEPLVIKQLAHHVPVVSPAGKTP